MATTMVIETETALEVFHSTAEALWTNERDDHIGPGESARALALEALIEATGGGGGAFAYPLTVDMPEKLVGIARDVVDNMEANEPDLLPGSVLIGDSDESIYEYFTRKLGASPSDGTLKNLPVRSGCGEDCKAAIDAAAALMRASKMAIGSTRAPAIRDIAEETVRVFWRG